MLIRNYIGARYHWFISGWIVILLLLASASVVIAQDTAPSDDEVNQVASQLYCPVCENIPLDVCALDACRQWRGLIRQQLSEGWTEEEIHAYFVAQYGDRVLGEPPRQGLNWLIYILPPAVILAGLLFTIMKLKNRPEGQPSIFEEFRDPYLEKVEQDLRNLD